METEDDFDIEAKINSQDKESIFESSMTLNECNDIDIVNPTPSFVPLPVDILVDTSVDKMSQSNQSTQYVNPIDDIYS